MSEPVARAFVIPTSSGLMGPNSTYIDVVGFAGVETGGTNPVTAVIREGSASGKVLGAVVCAAGGVSVSTLAHAVRSTGQLYAVITGTGTIAGSVHIL